jgi:hypothetical protein
MQYDLKAALKRDLGRNSKSTSASPRIRPNLHEGRRYGGAESMAAGRVGEAGLLRATLDHPQYVISVQPVLRQSRAPRSLRPVLGKGARTLACAAA